MRYIKTHYFPVFILMLSVLFAYLPASDQIRASSVAQPTPTPLLSSGVVNQWLHRSKLSAITNEDFETPTPTPSPSPTNTPSPAVAVVKKPITIVGSGILGYPLPHLARVTTYFSAVHKAIDLSAKCGTSVLNSYDGQITYAGWKNNGGGIVIDVTADNGMILNYVHLSAVAVGAGERVAIGQIIGYSGATGVSTGCHLHFGVIKDGIEVNPLLYL